MFYGTEEGLLKATGVKKRYRTWIDTEEELKKAKIAIKKINKIMNSRTKLPFYDDESDAEIRRILKKWKI